MSTQDLTVEEEQELPGDHSLPDLLPRTRKKRTVLQRVLYIGGAVLCILAGIAATPIPLISGLPFYVIAALLLASSSMFARRLINRLDRKLPHRARLALRSSLTKARTRFRR